jgi:hypothetical protein
MAWDENGKLVPLDEAQLGRQLELARRAARINPPLPDNPRLSFRATLRLVVLDITHMFDLIFFPGHESLPLAIAAQPPIILFFAVLYIAPDAFPLLGGAVVFVGLLRFWVWWVLERRR